MHLADFQMAQVPECRPLQKKCNMIGQAMGRRQKPADAQAELGPRCIREKGCGHFAHIIGQFPDLVQIRRTVAPYGFTGLYNPVQGLFAGTFSRVFCAVQPGNLLAQGPFPVQYSPHPPEHDADSHGQAQSHQDIQ